jgi:hypothetical protein
VVEDVVGDDGVEGAAFERQLLRVGEPVTEAFVGEAVLGLLDHPRGGVG